MNDRTALLADLRARQATFKDIEDACPGCSYHFMKEMHYCLCTVEQAKRLWANRQEIERLNSEYYALLRFADELKGPSGPVDPLGELDEEPVNQLAKCWSCSEIGETYGIPGGDLMDAKWAGWFPSGHGGEFLGAELLAWIRAGCPTTPRADQPEA